MGVRKQVEDFAVAMEAVLKENDWKDGWDTKSIIWLFAKLTDEVEELELAANIARRQGRLAGYEDIKKECVDIANFAMMIFDNAARKGNV